MDIQYLRWYLKHRSLSFTDGFLTYIKLWEAALFISFLWGLEGYTQDLFQI